MNKKELASSSEGLIGIFKGIGIPFKDIHQYLMALYQDNFLLMIRGGVEALAAIDK